MNREKITVVHVNDRSYDVYIGRGMRNPTLRESVFSNPFKINNSPDPLGFGNIMDRGEVLQSYWMMVTGDKEFWQLLHMHNRGYRELLRKKRIIWNKLPSLNGKTLACWCAGRHGNPEVLTSERPWVCHGQILAHLAEQREEQQRRDKTNE